MFTFDTLPNSFSKSVCMVVGDPVAHSLSPKIHNTWYKQIGIDNDFEYFATELKKDQLPKFIDCVKKLGIRGLSVTVPHKVSIIPFLDVLDDTAKSVGAVNTVVNNNGVLTGYNTDWIGVLKPLASAIYPEDEIHINSDSEVPFFLSQKKVAVFGAGGAARSAVYAILKSGGEVSVFNRTESKAKSLVNDFVKYGSISFSNDLYEVKDCDIVINSTTLGMEKTSDPENVKLTPISSELLNPNQIIFDMVYKPKETKLVREGLKVGAKIIYGKEMLISQAAEQFRLFTGREVDSSDL